MSKRSPQTPDTLLPWDSLRSLWKATVTRQRKGKVRPLAEGSALEGLDALMGGALPDDLRRIYTQLGDGLRSDTAPSEYGSWLLFGVREVREWLDSNSFTTDPSGGGRRVSPERARAFCAQAFDPAVPRGGYVPLNAKFVLALNGPEQGTVWGYGASRDRLLPGRTYAKKQRRLSLFDWLGQELSSPLARAPSEVVLDEDPVDTGEGARPEQPRVEPFAQRDEVSAALRDAGTDDPALVWETLEARGLLPSHDEFSERDLMGRRCECAKRNAQGCGECKWLGIIAEPWIPGAPVGVLRALASDLPRVRLARALLEECLVALEPWKPEVAMRRAWCWHTPNENAFGASLRPYFVVGRVEGALRNANLPLPVFSLSGPMFAAKRSLYEYARDGRRKWDLAASSGARVALWSPETLAHGALHGRPFSELRDPFTPLVALLELGAIPLGSAGAVAGVALTPFEGAR